MRTTSEIVCTCGAVFESAAFSGSCRTCGRDYRIMWPADYRKAKTPPPPPLVPFSSLDEL